MPRIWSEQHFTFTLPNQRKVDLLGFQLKLTYDGVLEATINERVNRLVLKHLEVPSYWRDSAIHREMPEDLTRMLPAFVCFAELISYDPISKPDHLSQLNFIWFINSIEGPSLKELIQQALNRLDWEAQAKEFEPNY